MPLELFKLVLFLCLMSCCLSVLQALQTFHEPYLAVYATGLTAYRGMKKEGYIAAGLQGT